MLKARRKWNEAGKDVVVLHMLPRAFKTLNLSPFPAKLETFLKINNIKYVTDFEYPMSSKGKTPWITINGVDVADSQLAIEYLCRKFNIDMNKHLTREEVAISRAMRSVLEDHFYFAFAYDKWVIGRGKCMYEQTEMPKGVVARFVTSIFLEKIAKLIEQQTYMQGIGRHHIDDIRRMLVEDVTTIADFLGEKRYMMGEKVSELDCITFGFMSIAKFAPVQEPLSATNFPNLANYVDRMKDEFFPDWDDLLKNKIRLKEF
jgi:glutathione S-transferase